MQCLSIVWKWLFGASIFEWLLKIFIHRHRKSERPQRFGRFVSLYGSRFARQGLLAGSVSDSLLQEYLSISYPSISSMPSSVSLAFNHIHIHNRLVLSIPSIVLVLLPRSQSPNSLVSPLLITQLRPRTTLKKTTPFAGGRHAQITRAWLTENGVCVEVAAAKGSLRCVFL
jgi:hypothetical protein